MTMLPCRLIFLQKNILYYDTMKQLKARKCPDNCEQHNDSYKISIDEWKELRKTQKAYYVR